MKFTQLILFLFIQIDTGLAAWSSGGGKGVVCRDRSGAIESVQFEDLYEAKKAGIAIKAPLNSLEDEWNRASATVLKLLSLEDLKTPGIETYLSQFDFVNRPLKTTNDSGLSENPPSGCNREQIAVFETFLNENKPVEVDTWKINKILWDHLSVQGRAALILHELIYSRAKLLNIESSEKVRMWIGHIFSVTQPKTFTPDSDWHVCLADEFASGHPWAHFFVKTTDFDTTLYFTRLGHSLAFGASIRTPRIPMPDYRFEYLGTPISEESNIFVRKKLNQNIWTPALLPRVADVTVNYRRGYHFEISLHIGQDVETFPVVYCQPFQ